MAIYKLGDISKIISGKDNEIKSGKYKVVGSGGYFGYTDKYITQTNSILLPRKGTMNILWIEPFVWNVDTAFLIEEVNEELVYKKYLYYYLLTSNWSKIIDSGSTRPATRITSWRNYEVNLASLDHQKEIIDIIEPMEVLRSQLYSIIDKITKIIYKLDIDETDETDIFESIKTGKHNANVINDDGEYNFYTCGKEIKKSNMSSFHGRYALLSGNGELFTWWVDGKFDLYQRVYALKEKKDFWTTYYSLEKGINQLRKRSNGAVIKFIKIEDIKSIRKFKNNYESILGELYNFKLTCEKLCSSIEEIIKKQIELLIK